MYGTLSLTFSGEGNLKWHKKGNTQCSTAVSQTASSDQSPPAAAAAALLALSQAILMLIINFSLELSFIRSEKVDYMHYSHCNIVLLLHTGPLHYANSSTYTHTPTQTLSSTVMKYARSVCSLINRGCRLEHI